MDYIKERASEICAFLIDSPEADAYDLLGLLYPDKKLDQTDRAVLEQAIENLQRYESTFDRVDTKAYALDLHEYTEELHKKDKRTFLFSGAACLFLTIFAVVNAFDSNEILLSRIFGLVASAFVLLFAHATCSTLKKQHDDPERVFEMCCEDSGLNERTEHAHHAIQCHIKDIRRFLELGT